MNAMGLAAASGAPSHRPQRGQAARRPDRRELRGPAAGERRRRHPPSRAGVHLAGGTRLAPERRTGWTSRQVRRPDTSTPVAVCVLIAYAVIYCIPCLVLLAIGLSHAGLVQGLLRLVHDVFGTEADLPANRWQATGLLAVSLLLAGVAARV